jgi:hypothetical protein
VSLTEARTGLSPEQFLAWVGEVHDRRCSAQCRNRPSCSQGWIQHVPAVGLLEAVQVLREQPRDAAGARRALHDRTCMSTYCAGDTAEDHARTQTLFVAALRKVLAAS